MIEKCMKSLDKSSGCDKTVLLLSGLICQSMGFRVGVFSENILSELRRKLIFNTKELPHRNMRREC